MSIEGTHELSRIINEVNSYIDDNMLYESIDSSLVGLDSLLVSNPKFKCLEQTYNDIMTDLINSKESLSQIKQHLNLMMNQLIVNNMHVESTKSVAPTVKHN
jgi:hypothetical protein